ncbi:hypothetical protein KGF56_003560 [Candida oxycetoniae]|uniref:Uncharacterized protein n=1 Tax=Candida oxycetoniae TaxID=497107 RepID=A0AAI9SV55_9ASCO|nr:uncharacterized protein KGF56_003560 [Candida oxycetoniae]KAI3403633.2 hypothetical protein KGF56_003560 [Candida oxycetoniae]
MYSVEYLWTDDDLDPSEYEPLFPIATLSVVVVSRNIDQTLSNYVKYMDPWVNQYPWNYKQPDCQARVTDNIEYIYGEFQHHGHTPDMELFIAMLLNFTKYDTDCFIHVFDSLEIEPILVLCHDCLPDELQSVTGGRNRAWLHNDSVIVLNQHDDEDRFLMLKRAIYQIFNGDWTRREDLTMAVKTQCSIEKGLGHVHDVTFKLPILPAKVITKDLMMVARSLAALETIEEIQLIEFDDGVDVTVPMNAMNLGTLITLGYQFRNDGNDEEGEGKGKKSEYIIGGLLLAGLHIYYKGKQLPKVPESITINSRYVLQDELINRGIIEKRVDEEKDLLDLLSNRDFLPNSQDDEEEYAEKLRNIFEQGYENMEAVFEEEKEQMEQDDDDDDDDDDDYEGIGLSEDLKDFRWKYYDMTGKWLSVEEVPKKYEEVKNSMMQSNIDFRHGFKDTEFEDFPEFMESEIVLNMSEEKKEKNKCDRGGTHQGDMSYDEYVTLRKTLKKDAAESSGYSDEDWEDIEEEEEEEDDDDDTDTDSENEELLELYDERPKLESLDENKTGDTDEPEMKLSQEEIEQLTKNLQQMQTNDKTNLESLFRKTRK